MLFCVSNSVFVSPWHMVKTEMWIHSNCFEKADDWLVKVYNSLPRSFVQYSIINSEWDESFVHKDALQAVIEQSTNLFSVSNVKV